MLDQLVFDAVARAGVDNVMFASSGRVDPNGLETDPTRPVYLTEDPGRAAVDADNLYGWAKLMAR